MPNPFDYMGDVFDRLAFQMAISVLPDPSNGGGISPGGGTTDDRGDGIRVHIDGVISPPNQGDGSTNGISGEKDDTGHVWILPQTEINSGGSWIDKLSPIEKIIYYGFNDGTLGPRPETISF